jgi:acetolactate synthase-1/3 small subunit
MMKHTLVALVENKPGVLNRVASLFRRRNYNIDSLTVGRTHNPEVSRMTIVMDEGTDAAKVEQNLYKMVNVIEVANVSQKPTVTRDLALVKMRVDAQTRGQVLQICDIFRARVVDAGPTTMMVEVTGDEAKISSLIELLRPIGILEMVRTGVVTMARGEEMLQEGDYVARNGKGSKSSSNGSGVL